MLREVVRRSRRDRRTAGATPRKEKPDYERQGRHKRANVHASRTARDAFNVNVGDLCVEVGHLGAVPLTP